MRQLSDELLIDAYHAAVEHQLEQAFIMMLFAEIKRRKVDFAKRNNSFLSISV